MKAHCYFLIVITSNLCPILHHFKNTEAYRSKIANSFLPQSYLMPLLGVAAFEFRDEPDIIKY